MFRLGRNFALSGLGIFGHDYSQGVALGFII